MWKDAGKLSGQTSDNLVFVYGVFFKCSAKTLCYNQFVSTEFLERGFQTTVNYVTTDLFGSPARWTRWIEGFPSLEGKKAPVLREQLCPLKRVAGLQDRLISNRRRGIGNCLEYTGAAKGVTPWGHPRQNIISMNEGGASSCFVHYVLST